MSNKRERLLAQFPDVTTAQWEAVIERDLKGADYDRKLVWHTDEGFNVRPYYRAENLDGFGHIGSEAGCFPYVRGIRKCNNWRVHQVIPVRDVATANRQACEAIGSGAMSIGFRMDCDELTDEQIETLLTGIDLNNVELVFTNRKVRRMVTRILAIAEQLGANKQTAQLCFVLDPLMRHLSTQGDVRQASVKDTYKIIIEIIRATTDWKFIRLVGISGEVFHNSGATIVQELAYTLAAGHEYLSGLMSVGLAVDEVAHRFRFSMAVSSNYFMELAKFRAAKLLWANIVNAYRPGRTCSEQMFIHAVTSEWNLTAYDPYVNMLRGTTEAMSAALAGVESLEVVPFDAAYEEPTEFAARISRNVQLLLKHESHFDEVVDPAGGSYYIENLTDSLVKEAWRIFCEIEQAGGYVEVFRSGAVVEAINASAAAKKRAIATRRTTLLGTNQYPNFTETSDAPVAPSEHSDNVLTPWRGAEAFEQLRMSVDRSGRSPRAFMLTCGTLAMARARAQFASNFFACAGIRPVDNTFFNSVEEGAAAAKQSGAEIVVLCASDDDYAVLTPIAKSLLDPKQIFVVAGAPACQAELEAAGINNFISVKSNVLETLKSYVSQIGIN